jgi:hypothetical protein
MSVCERQKVGTHDAEREAHAHQESGVAALRRRIMMMLLSLPKRAQAKVQSYQTSTISSANTGNIIKQDLLLISLYPPAAT